MATLADLLAAAQGSLFKEPVPTPTSLLEQTRQPSPLDNLLRPYQNAILGRPAGGLGGFAQQPLAPIGPTGVPGIPSIPSIPSGPTPYAGPTSFTPIRTGHVPIEDRRPPELPSATEVAPPIQRVYNEVWARWPSSSNLGTHVVKYIRNDPDNGLSEHSFGDAIDIGGPPDQLEEQASWLANHAAELNITEVIFRDRIWTDDAGWHPYTSGGHDTHVHVTGPQTYSDTTPSFPEIDWQAPRRQRPTSTDQGTTRTTSTPTRTRTRHRRPSPGELQLRAHERL